jgi:colicin import membrane protein
MNRLQKKCLIASGLLHGLLCLVLLVGPAFLSSKEQKEPIQIIELVNVKIVDSATRGGVATAAPAAVPDVAPAPIPVQPEPEKPTPAPLKPETPPVEKKVEPEPAPKKTVPVIREPEKKPPVKPPKETVETKKTPPKAPEKAADKKIDISKPVTRNSNEFKLAQEKAREAKLATERDAQRRRDLDNLLQGASRDIREKSSATTSVELSGIGGEAFVNYSDFLRTAYQQKFDQALLVAGDIAEGRAQVTVSVTVGRDGKVVSARVTKKSGNTALDKVVQRVLDRVTFIAPFPEGAKDQERTFPITFELNPKRQLG